MSLETLQEQVDGLMEKYTELLVGESTPELKEKVKLWAMYTHLSKTMPPLAKHWNQTYPDAKDEMKELVEEIKLLNEENRKSQQDKE
ncbi:YusU family protein [Guptibacillus algicola]|uniref:YusU family protein n=1 Tax=Guptibacillus algicola TaxID=225844 RepID=UPI001CD80C55|nr:YusU family protein [Alkalihalobacillus algicola]MCA0986705.1 YusU family protein [Alkalihalobacillus algicola]